MKEKLRAGEKRYPVQKRIRLEAAMNRFPSGWKLNRGKLADLEHFVFENALQFKRRHGLQTRWRKRNPFAPPMLERASQSQTAPYGRKSAIEAERARSPFTASRLTAP